MSEPPPPIADPEDLLGTYGFLPWLRQGIAKAIAAPPAAGIRASIHVELDMAGTPIAATRRSRNPSVRTYRFMALATSSASTLARSFAPSREQELRISSRTISRPSIFMTRISRGGIRLCLPRGCNSAPGSHSSYSTRPSTPKARTSPTGRCRSSPLAIQDSCLPQPNCGHGRTCTSTRDCRRSIDRAGIDRHGRRDSARAGDSQCQS